MIWYAMRWNETNVDTDVHRKKSYAMRHVAVKQKERIVRQTDQQQCSCWQSQNVYVVVYVNYDKFDNVMTGIPTIIPKQIHFNADIIYRIIT